MKTFNIKSGQKYSVGSFIYYYHDMRTGKKTTKKLKVLSCNESTSAYIRGKCYQLKVKEVVK